MTPPRLRRGRGFTLIELLIVIVIIGILLGLLIPAITGAIHTTHEAAVSAEINLLANALASFKDKYGDFPPSRLLLAEDGGYDTTDTTHINSASTDLTYGQLAQRSMRYLRQFFPRAIQKPTDLDQDGKTDTYGEWPDYNGDGKKNTGYYLLEGHECLVFFLGGIPSSSGTGMAGFAKNPVNPFVSDNPNLAGASSNRNPPFFEFKTDRLVRDPRPNHNHGIPGYVDSLERPNGGTNLGDARFFAYFSAYGGNGYDPNDVNFGFIPGDASFVGETDDSGTALSRAFLTTFTGVNSGGKAMNVIFSTAPNPYTSSPAVPTNAVTYINANTYQIISAGRDRLYGFGGRYDANSNDRLPIDPNDVTDSLIVPANNAGIRIREQDNLANFASGRLD